MCELYKTLSRLCEDRKITGYRMCKDCGISPGAMTDLKAGRKRTLSAVNMQKLADYFGVSVDYLLGAEKERTAAPKSDGLSPEDARIMDLLRRLSPENKRKFAEILEALAEPPTQAPGDQA